MTRLRFVSRAALNNAQGELHPLEIGLHALRSGLTFKEYSSRTGIDDRALRTRIYAAEVVESGDIAVDPKLWSQLAEIHAAPRWLWSALVAEPRPGRSLTSGRCRPRWYPGAPKRPTKQDQFGAQDLRSEVYMLGWCAQRSSFRGWRFSDEHDFAGLITSAAVQLGKALEDPEQGLAALRRVGVSFTEAQRELIKSLVESGQQLEAQRVILEAVERQVGGAGEAQAGEGRDKPERAAMKPPRPAKGGAIRPKRRG